MPDSEEQHPEDAHDQHVVGSVADEAAQLVELLSGRHPLLGREVPRPTVGPEATKEWDGAGTEAGGRSGAAGGRGREGGASGAEGGPSGTPRPGPRGECTCGGRAPTCSVCPVCLLISFVSQISPETIERAADFVGFAATALHDLAAVQRESSAASESRASGEPGEPGEPGDGETASPRSRPDREPHR